jgi:hypothetical protein
MIIEHEHKYIFEHVPKTGGTFLRTFYRKFYPQYARVVGHAKYSNYIDNHEYDLVIGIRNPIDRIVSLFCDICDYEKVKSFDAKINKEYEFYSIDDEEVGLRQEWIDDRLTMQNDNCSGNCIEYFLNNQDENNIYFSSKIEKSIKAAKNNNRKVYVLRQECLVNDLLVFFDSKNIKINDEQMDWLLNKSFRKSDKQTFINAKKQLLRNKKLLHRIIEKERFLCEIYSVEFS